MALSNRDRVGKALDLLREGLVPFVEREMQSRLGQEWLDKTNQGLTRGLSTREARPLASSATTSVACGWLSM